MAGCIFYREGCVPAISVGGPVSREILGGKDLLKLQWDLVRKIGIPPKEATASHAMGNYLKPVPYEIIGISSEWLSIIWEKAHNIVSPQRCS